MAVKILFQGDSITDAERSRDQDFLAGSGYPTIVAGELGLEHPGKYEFVNRGVSGNRSVDLLSRVRNDIINLRPDVMSILIGVNDVWHELATGNGVSAKYYEVYYKLIIEEVKSALPDIRIMLLEPFVLKASATEEKWDIFRGEVEKRAAAAQRVAKSYGLEFITLQNKFDEAAKLAAPDYWLTDGVHPTPAGHALIAHEWIKKFKKQEGGNCK